MSDRTTINVAKDAHQAAKPLKEENDHSWSDVLEWYAEHVENGAGLDVDALQDAMNQISMANTPGVELDVDEILSEVGKAVELAEQARDNTQDLKERIQ